MSITKYNLFPTHVLYWKNFLTDVQVKDIFNYVMSESSSASSYGAIVGDGVTSYYSTGGKYLQDIVAAVPSCSNLIVKINSAVNTWSEGSGYKAGHLHQSWFNIQNEGSRLDRHFHPGSTTSGALYIHTDHHSTPILFDSPNPYQDLLERTPNTCSFSSYFFSPLPGDLIIFPFWLHHHSGPDTNRTKNRTVISFNYSYFSDET